MNYTFTFDFRDLVLIMSALDTTAEVFKDIDPEEASELRSLSKTINDAIFAYKGENENA